MLIIGCDYHPGFQQIAFVDTETGECGERRRLLTTFWMNGYNPAMRKGFGIALILIGAIGIELCGIALWGWPLPIPGFILRRLGGFGLFVDPVKGPITAVVSLAIGFLLLLKPKLTRPKGQ